MERQHTGVEPAVFGWVEAAPFRAWARHLMTVGRVDASDIALLSGLSPCLVEHLVEGRGGRPIRRISPYTAMALLLVSTTQAVELGRRRVPMVSAA